MLDHSPLEAVYIFFDTATYDEIERDEKVTQISAVQHRSMSSTLVVVVVCDRSPNPVCPIM